jgi:hypothetical protein
LNFNLSKCEFAKTSIGFFGHVVSKEGTQFDQRKVKTLIEYPMPILVTNGKAFLGFTNYYHN